MRESSRNGRTPGPAAGQNGAQLAPGGADRRPGDGVGAGRGGIRLAVDTGGTFTDVVARRADGSLVAVKVPTDAAAPTRSFMTGLRTLSESLDLSLSAMLECTERISHGTTLGVNALLEERLARTALLTTEGFRDALELRRSRLPDQWNLRYRPPLPLVPRRLRLGVRGRMDSAGRELVPLDEGQVAATAAALRREGVEAVAICLLFSYLNPGHEQAAAAILRGELPGTYVCISSDVAPRMGEYERTSTTVLNAGLGPLIEEYLAELEAELQAAGWRGGLHLVLNSGVLNDAAGARGAPVKTLLSGPAGGARGAEVVARVRAAEVLTVADMGGTSFDTHVVLGRRVPLVAGAEVAGHPLALPLVDVHSVGAGGGSLLSVDGAGTVRVGPASAGSAPGPACYGKGGERATLTDAALVLGLLGSARPISGGIPLDPIRAAEAVRCDVARPLGLGVDEAAWVAYRVAVAQMADAVRLVTVRRGIDPAEGALLAAGGAFPLFAAEVAAELGVQRILVPLEGPTWCAWGMLETGCGHEVVEPCPLSKDRWEPDRLEAALRRAAEAGGRELERLGVPRGGREGSVVLEMRYVDQHHHIDVTPDGVEVDPPGDGHRTPLGVPGGFSPGALDAAFHARHRVLYGYAETNKPWQVLGLRLSLREAAGPQSGGPAAGADGSTARWREAAGSPWGGRPSLRRAILDENGPRNVPVWGTEFTGVVRGPALVELAYTTVVVPAGFALTPPEDGILALRREVAA